MTGVEPKFFIGNENAANESKEISTMRRALPQFIAVGVKNMLLLGYGMTLGFPTILIPAIKGGDGRDPRNEGNFLLSDSEISWLSSINLLFVPIGCIFSGVFTESLGKRKAMQIINIPMFCAWLLLYFASRENHLYAGLCLTGLSGGLMESPVLTYVAEITQPQFRGMLAATGTTCVITGVFIQFILGSVFTWRSVALISSVLPFITTAALFFVPESPHWLLTQGRIEEARGSLSWLRGWVPFHRVETEFNEIYDVLNRKRIETLSKKNDSCFHKAAPYTKMNFLTPFVLISATFFIGHFGGKTPLQTYAVQIFATLKAPINKYHATIFLGAAELVGCLLCVFLVHVTGKRPLVFISTIGCGLCFLGTATYARYLNLVPGVTVSNIVANASSADLGNSTLIINDQTVNDTLNNLYPLHQNLSAILNSTRHFESEPNSREFEAISTTEISLHNEYSGIAYRVKRKEMVPDNDTVAENVNKILTKLAKQANNSEDTNSVLLNLPETEKNEILWLPLTLLLTSALLAHMGIRVIPWMLIGEIFPVACRSGASGFASGLGYAFGFLANKLFLQMLATMTLPGTFWFYSSVSLLGCLILYFVLPETEGRTLIEIEEHFSGGRSLFESKLQTMESDRGFDHISMRPPISETNKAYQETLDHSEIPEYVKNATAIGVKRNVNDHRRRPVQLNGSKDNNDSHTTQF